MTPRLGALAARLRTSPFVRNLATVSGGTLVSQAVPMLTYPLLTRLVTPEQYGGYARFSLAVALLSGASTGRYEMALLTPRDEAGARAVRQHALSLAVVFAIVAIPASFAVLELGLVRARWVQWALPLTLLATATLQVLNAWQLRQQRFRALSASRIVRALAVSLLSVGGALLGLGEVGLVMGALLGTALAAFVLLLEDRRAAASPPLLRAKLIAAAREHRRFPFFALPSEWLSTAAGQLPLVFLDGASAGYFSFASTIVNTPLSFVAGSVQEAFKERASREYRERGSFQTIYRGVFAALAVVGMVGALVLALVGPSAFSVLFGARWETAGTFARWLAPMFAVRLMASPLSYSYFIVGKQVEDLALQAYALASTAVLLFTLGRLEASAQATILLYGANFATIYVVFVVRTWQFANQGPPAG